MDEWCLYIILLMAQNPKFKIKQFEWFEMETKVRQIIQEVLGPMQKRILQTSNTLHKVKINQGQDQDKIHQITLMIANDPKVFECGVFQRVDRRFQEQTKHIEQLSRQIKEASKYVDEKFKILDIRMEESSQVLRNVASLRERISKQIQLQNDNISQLRNNLTDMISNLQQEVKASRRMIQSNLQNEEKERLVLGQKIRTMTGNIQTIEAVLQGHKEMHRDKAIKLQQHTQTLNNHREDIHGLQQSKALTKKLQQYVKHMDNQLTRAEFKIDNISPLITQAQISDCLFSVLPGKLRKRVTVHEYKKYFHLNRQVLQKPYKEVVQRFRGVELLQQMQKRNTKEIVQMKRKKLLGMGVDIDHLTYQQRQRYYAQVQLDEAMDNDDDQVKINNKIDQKQILSMINTYFVDFTANTSQKVKLELQDSKKYIYGLEEQLRNQMIGYELKYDAVRRQCQTFQTEQLLQNKSLLRGDRDIMANVQRLRTQVGGMKEMQRLFYNFCSLVNHLQIQDQIDKQNISLMGVQESSSDKTDQLRQRNSILQLDKKCFSCCGYPASTLSAFKMACLTYNPSSIRIDNKDYKREQLLQFTTNMLHNIKRAIQIDSSQSSLQLNQTIHPSQPQLSSNINPQINSTIQYNANTIQPNKLQLDTYQQSKFMGKVDTQENQVQKTANNKFRKRTKYQSINSGSGTKYHSNSRSKNNSFLNEQMSTVSAAFQELKRRNISFLC